MGAERPRPEEEPDPGECALDERRGWTADVIWWTPIGGLAAGVVHAVATVDDSAASDTLAVAAAAGTAAGCLVVLLDPRARAALRRAIARVLAGRRSEARGARRGCTHCRHEPSAAARRCPECGAVRIPGYPYSTKNPVRSRVSPDLLCVAVLLVVGSPVLLPLAAAALRVLFFGDVIR